VSVLNFEGKVCVVTGGGSGIGREISLQFARGGATIVIADINLSAALETQESIASSGGKGLAFKVDVSQSADVKQMVKQVVEKLGKVNILVNNAGVIVRASILETSEEDWDRIMAVDLRGVYLCIKHMVPEMIKAGGGKIVNISSLTGLVGLTAPAYTAAKGGVISLTRILAGELAPYKINVNTVCPGFIMTPISENLLRSELGEVVKKKVPWKRYGTAKDVADVVLFFASVGADYVTGTILPVDGGLGSFLDFGEEYRTFDQRKVAQLEK
jgi:NAD(P)-dependent dehydrogenase (short-subunit alcohol dehydrogenase family)